MADIVDRLETVTRRFDRALFYGAGPLVETLSAECGISHIINADLAAQRVASGGARIVCDEEWWPFAPAQFDLIVSLLTLHHANDLVGALTQMRQSLKPDGLFLGVLFGEETLKSMREALYAAEAESAGGVSPRVIPFASVRDLGGALQRAGFAMPVADMDAVTVRYANPLKLFADLRAMGETNVLKNRGAPLTRQMIARAAQGMRDASADADSVEVEFNLVYLTGWAPATTQPKPLRPGSATQSMAEAVKKL